MQKKSWKRLKRKSIKCVYRRISLESSSFFIPKYVVIKLLSASFILFFLSQALFSQDKKTSISGLIENTSFVGVENVHVINLNTKKVAITDAKGLFKMNVTEGDSLLISNIQYQKGKDKNDL